MSEKNIIAENRAYWSKRAATYSSDIRSNELGGETADNWLRVIRKFIDAQFGNKAPGEIRILDIGTGPGFFAIIFARAGFRVTAIDLTPSMLAEARKNADDLADSICFLEMNAQKLAFADAAFDLIVTRNLTWDLPDPETAYKEWHRVLRYGGLLLNFDSNWYRYLFDEEARAGYEADQANAKALGRTNENPDVDYAVMEKIAAEIPLSRALRPAWDLHCLTALGFDAVSYDDIWRELWSADDQVAYASTPMFLVRAVKK